MTMLWLCMIYFWIHTTVVASQGYYKVTGPKEVRPNSEYHAAISVQGSSVPIFFDVIIEGVQNNGARYRTEETVRVAPYRSEIVTLKVGDILPGNYTLSLAGRSGFNLFSSIPLSYLPKTHSVLIQTDRAVYNPGSKILFRALILTPQLRPAAELRNEPFDVLLVDGDGNTVRVWDKVFAPKGVFAEEFQLSKNPVLGNWNISVSLHGYTYNKTIEVANYILPKFTIDIQAPKFITFRENILIIHIQSFYDYGKKVEGIATVTVYPTIFSGVIQPIFQNPVRKVLSILGSVTVEFDIANELKLNEEYERTVFIDVTIEEALTGRKQNNHVEVHVRKYPYKMEIIKTSDYYKPGLKYTAFIKITNQDGTSIENRSNPVRVRYGFSRVGEIYKNEEYNIDRNGLIKLELETPTTLSNKTALRIDAEYLDLKERMPPVPAAISPSNTFLQVVLLTEKLLINTAATMMVNCTEPMKYINYEIISKGNVVLTNTLEIQNRKEFNFNFRVTHAMVPISHIIVNYVRDDGELVADSIDVEVDGVLQNSINVQLSRTEVIPDSVVDITVRAESNSYIGLLAIDQNTANLRNGYDLTYNAVFRELLSFDPSDLSPYWAIMKDAMSHFFWKPGGSNIKDIYQDSGAVLLTNSLVTDFQPTLEDIYLRPVFYEASTVKPDRGVGLPIPSATRPPLAGPYAFSRIPKPVWNSPKVFLKQDIADTWLFTNFSSGVEGKASIHRKIPSTTTSWLITGFSLDSAHGLGITKTPIKLRVMKNLIVKFDLPSSIQRREVITIPVVIYNNVGNDIIVDVTLQDISDKFELTHPPGDQDDSKKVESQKKKKVKVMAHNVATTSFIVTALKIGWTKVEIMASGSFGQDTASKSILIKAEGEPQYYSKTLFIDLHNARSIKDNITIDIPKNIVSNSENIEVSVVGDLLGPAMINLENLIRIPTGCGEQNIVHLIPDIIILKYLRNTGQLTLTIEKEAIKNLEIGYQTQLSYKRNDGSFSAFGKRDNNGSIWVTAYTALALKKAKKFIYVDDKVIEDALHWLRERKHFDGSFIETGPIIHHELQSDPLALTAFVVLTFMETQDSSSSYMDIAERGLDYIARNIGEEKPVYTIAICSYVLQKADHPLARNAFNLLDLKAKTGNNTKWWEKDVSEKEKNNPWNYLPKSIDTEITAYGLLTFLKASRLEDAIPIINWLVDQGNNLGGFTSSHDTVVGLFAIYKLVTKLSAKPSIEIQYTSKPGTTGSFRINENSAMIVQKAALNNSVREIQVKAEGSGIALLRVSYQYNVNVTGPWPLFTLDPQVDKNSNEHHLQLSVCTGFVSSSLVNSPESNMAVMEVNLPSGFTADIDSLPSLEVSQHVQKVETKNEDTIVVLYFNNLTSVEYCPTVSAFKTHKVANQKPVSVIIYDYYDSSRKARIFYSGTVSTICDICEENCDKFCTVSNPWKVPGVYNGYGDKGNENITETDGAGVTALSSILILVMIMFTLNSPF